MQDGPFRPEATPERVGHDEELRLAISMRGGVSLAVWIGGALAEIDQVRQAGEGRVSTSPENGNQRVYGQLLELSRYDDVTVDVLTGASAGGLNGAIYAASLVYGFDFAQMADLWIRLADIEALCRPTPWRRNEGRRPSLLEGDAYFLRECTTRLKEFIAGAIDRGASTTTTPRLDLFLSATRTVPVAVTFRDDSSNRIAEARSSAFFHFRHIGGLDSPLSDFRADDGASNFDGPAARLALAGRSTSSFPVAFEPATIHSHPDAAASMPSMFGMFSEVDDDPVSVIDGGVLDNIPVARAIQAIAAAPASGPASRWLLYLHPSPADPADAPTGPGVASDLTGILRDLKTTFSLKFDAESLVEDMAVLERHNTTVANRRTARVSLLAAAGAASGETLNATVHFERARAAWAATDARRIAVVLNDPNLAFATHPFVSGAFGPNLVDDPTEPSIRAAFDAHLSDVLTSGYGPIEGTLGLLALGDVVEVLLALSQQVVAGPAEAALYRVRLTVEVLTSIWEQRWATAARDHPPPTGSTAAEVKDWIAGVSTAARDASEHLPVTLIPALVGNVDTMFHSELRAAYDMTGDGARVSITELWGVVAAQAEILVQAAAGVLDDDPIVAAIAGRDLMADGLRDMAIATAPLHRRALSGESTIRFLRVSSLNRSPLESLFTSLAPLTVERKLAGNQMANFGAFFSARWRANDWMWGQLDAAVGMVELLSDSRRWFRSTAFGGSRTVDDVLGAVRGSVLTPLAGSDGEDGPWAAYLSTQWTQREAAVRDELVVAANAPLVAAELAETRAVLLTRLHAELLAQNLPVIKVTPSGAAPDFDRPTIGAGQSETVALAAGLRTGLEAVPSDLDPIRWSRIGMRLGLNTWRAVRPPRWCSLLKPVYLFVLAVVVFPRRSLITGIVGFGSLAVGRWETPEADNQMWSGNWFARDLGEPGAYWTWQRWIATVVTMLLAATLAVVHRRTGRTASAPSRPRRTVERVATAIGLGLAVVTLVSVSLKVSMPPVIVPMAAVIVVLVGMGWMRRSRLLLCLVVALVPYVGLWFVVRATDWFSPGWWAIAAFGSAVALSTAYVTFVDVFPARPRAGTDGSARQVDGGQVP